MKYDRYLHDGCKIIASGKHTTSRVVDPDAVLALLDEIERLQEENHALDQINRDIQTADAHLDEVLAELARRDEIITRLKEDASMLALLLLLNGKFTTDSELKSFHSVVDAHRALMKEINNE